MEKLKYNIEQVVRLLSQAFLCIRIFDLPLLSHFRDLVYRILFNAGNGLHVGHNIYIDREHQKYDGSISIGKNVLLAHNCHLDYTGYLVIKDNVKITDGVHILTHAEDIVASRSLKGMDCINIQTPLVIEENAFIGNHAIILPSCNYIGKNAIIGAGAIVTKDVPDNQVFCGEAARFLKDVSTVEHVN